MTQGRGDSEIVELLGRAAAAVEDAGLASDFRTAGFLQACKWLTPATAADSRPNSALETPQGGDKTNESSGGALLDRLAEAMKLDREKLDYVFAEEDNTLVLSVNRSQLSEDRVTAQREVALLLAAGRQIVGIDPDRTHTDAIRHQAEELGLVRKNTFRDEMGRLGSAFSSRPIGRFGRGLKVMKIGRDEALTLVRRIINEAE
jgi:hypothetical protein